MTKTNGQTNIATGYTHFVSIEIQENKKKDRMQRNTKMLSLKQKTK